MDSHRSDRNDGVHHEEEIVIVGGGVGGLACALALHRVGMKSIVLEREDSLNRGGSALLLWNNAFHVLEVLGLAEKLRAMYTKLLSWEMLNPEGKPLGKVEFAECKGGPHDVRVVERRALLAILAGEVSEGTIRYNSCVSGITVTDNETGITEVALQDGSTYSAKVVTGFDGTNSCVGS